MHPPALIIVQARIGSSRFPHKVLHPLLGQPMLLWQLERLSHVDVPHILTVAAPSTPENEAIEVLCHRHGYLCYRPDVPEDDVLGRFVAVANRYASDDIVRICGDCPLVDPAVVSDMLRLHWARQSDLTAIAAEWPDGMDIEAMRRDVLRTAATAATLPSDRSHVTPWIWRQPERFRLETLPCPVDLSSQCWSVDTPHELALVEQLLRRTMQRTGLRYGWHDFFVTLLLHPNLADMMGRKRIRNQAYLDDVAKEQGIVGQSWEAIRYGHT